MASLPSMIPVHAVASRASLSDATSVNEPSEYVSPRPPNPSLTHTTTTTHIHTHTRARARARTTLSACGGKPGYNLAAEACR